MSKRPGLSDAEREVLQSLWDDGPGTVRAVQERMATRGPEWTRSTVITLLQRLERKGYVASDRSDYAFVFQATVSREDVLRQRLQEVADELADGRAAPLLLAFAQGQRFTPDELQNLRQLIDELASASRKRK
jgi:predicted transcriptional regulator